MPVNTVAMPSRIWVPKAEWMAIEARRLDRLHAAREDDQRGDHDPGPPAVEEMEQEGVVGQRMPAPGVQSMPSGKSLPCISGQSLAT